MKLMNRELCATCPDRGTLSCTAAKLLLGKEYRPEDCSGPEPIRKDKKQFSTADHMFGGVITEITYECGKPNIDSEPKPDYVTFNWFNGELVSTINHVTGVYTNYPNPECSDTA